MTTVIYNAYITLIQQPNNSLKIFCCSLRLFIRKDIR